MWHSTFRLRTVERSATVDRDGFKACQAAVITATEPNNLA